MKSQGESCCAKLGAEVSFFGAPTNVTLRELGDHRESRRICRIIIAEVLFGAVKARLSVLCAYNSFNNSGRKETLGRLGSGGTEQRNYLFHRPQNLAVGFIPANLFCLVLYAVNLKAWRKAETVIKNVI